MCASTDTDTQTQPPAHARAHATAPATAPPTPPAPTPTPPTPTPPTPTPPPHDSLQQSTLKMHTQSSASAHGDSFFRRLVGGSCIVRDLCRGQVLNCWLAFLPAGSFNKAVTGLALGLIFASSSERGWCISACFLSGRFPLSEVLDKLADMDFTDDEVDCSLPQPRTTQRLCSSSEN